MYDKKETNALHFMVHTHYCTLLDINLIYPLFNQEDSIEIKKKCVLFKMVAEKKNKDVWSNEQKTCNLSLTRFISILELYFARKQATWFWMINFIFQIVSCANIELLACTAYFMHWISKVYIKVQISSYCIINIHKHWLAEGLWNILISIFHTSRRTEGLSIFNDPKRSLQTNLWWVM